MKTLPYGNGSCNHELKFPLDKCPAAGTGVHRWVMRMAWRCRKKGASKEQAVAAITAAMTRPPQPGNEVEQAVAKVYETKERKESLKWPERDFTEVEQSREELSDLWEASPVRFDTDPLPEEILPQLFPGDPLVCAGLDASRFETKRLSEFTDWERREFIVPSPMSAPQGRTQAGHYSAKSNDNTGPRRFLVLESDVCNDHQQAAIFLHFKRLGAPLVMAVSSGGKSLHGWFYCEGVPEDVLLEFMRHAVKLGADKATWTPSQFVRTPGAVRAENGRRQRVYYFDPEAMKAGPEAYAFWQAKAAGEADPRVEIALPRNGILDSDFAAELGAILGETGEIFTRNGAPFIANIAEQRLEPAAPLWFQTWAERHVKPFTLRQGKDGETEVVYRTMPESLARAVLASPQFAECLPPVTYFHPCPMPVMRKDGRVELLPEGYDCESEAFTAPPGFSLREMPFDEARAVIDDLLAEFPFADERSKAVAIAAMVTVFARRLLPPGALCPAFIYLANEAGAGKTLLATLAGAPFRTTAVETAPSEKEEWQKKLLAAVIAGKSLILFDNMKGHLSSEALESYLTSRHYSERILGESKNFTGEACATVLITGNALTISPDMRRRSLVCELFMRELRAEERRFRRTLDAAELERLRPDILSALWAFVRHWDAKGRPGASFRNSSFPRWCDIIAGIVEAAGCACPCHPAELRDMGDTETADFAAMAAAMEPGREYTFADLVALCEENGWFERLVADKDNTGDLTRGSKAKLAKIFARFDRRRVSPSASFIIAGKGRSRRYLIAGDCPAGASIAGGCHGGHGCNGVSPLSKSSPEGVEKEISKTPEHHDNHCNHDNQGTAKAIYEASTPSPHLVTATIAGLVVESPAWSHGQHGVSPLSKFSPESGGGEISKTPEHHADHVDHAKQGAANIPPDGGLAEPSEEEFKELLALAAEAGRRHWGGHDHCTTHDAEIPF